MKLEIEKSLIVSTAHISKEDGKLLDAIDVGHLIVDKYSFGWRVLVGDDDLDITDISSKFSQGFIAAVIFTKTHGCEWLQLDSDGPEYECLGTYEW